MASTVQVSASRHSLGAAQRLASELCVVQRMVGWYGLAQYCWGIGRNFREVAGSRNLQPADRAMAGRRWNCRVGATTVEIAGEDFTLAREICGRRAYFIGPKVHLRAGDVVIDLGANVGMFSVLAARLGARVIAVEAQDGFLGMIQENARRNGCENAVDVVWGMVGSGSGVLSCDEGRRSASHLKHEPPTISIADVVGRAGGKVSFLKIDIEGSEYSLFRDDRTWLAPVARIAMEVHCPFGDPAEIAGVLRGEGFVVTLIDNRGIPVDVIPDVSGYLVAWRPS